MRRIVEVAGDLGLGEDDLEQYGPYKAKLTEAALERLREATPGRLVLVTGMTPTTAGEGKTTTAIGLTQGLRLGGARATVCLREPSVGPVMGIKGGGTGGGQSEVLPADEINLHFTGDLHAVTTANNLLSATLDASIFHGNEHRIDVRRVTWRRCMDMNDRSLRHIVVGLGAPADGISAAGGVRHHPSVRGDGDPLGGARPRGPAPAAARGDRRVHARVGASAVRADRRRGGDDRAAEARDAAQPSPNERRRPGSGARRPVRQHRAGVQQHQGDEGRAGDVGGGGDGGGVRLRPGGGEVLQRGLALRAVAAGGGGDRRDGAGAEAARGAAGEGAGGRGPGRARGGAAQPGRAHRQRAGARGYARGGGQPLPQRRRRGDRSRAAALCGSQGAGGGIEAVRGRERDVRG